ncbi:MAG: hypothetical protein MOGMAGMI_00002 [Candidatus Omnitrophica bacterium]|nr:hypothetical protein [Candidatus Omnitrophota bacterium]
MTHNVNLTILRFTGRVLLYIGLVTAFFCPSSWANNIAVTNVEIASQDTTANTVTIEFDISWSNSWRDSTNFDAAWVFIKYSTDSGTSWKHATLKSSGLDPSGFDIGTGTELELWVPKDKKGVSVQRASQGSGSLSTTDVQVIWHYGVDQMSDSSTLIGDTDAIASSTQIKVMAIEMVFIPEEGFYAGDGSAGTAGQLEFGGSGSSLPGALNSEGGMSFGTGAGQWYYNTPGSPNTGEASDGASFEVTEAFPKGFHSFYIMKYEITEGLWVAFFNTLNSNQKSERDITGNHASLGGKNSDSTVNRNTISWTSGDASTSREDRACGYLSYVDVAAFADWAALRPMSELEFEKVCRGPLYPVAGEFAWGTTSSTVATTISGTENGTETISTSNANVVFNNTNFSGGDTGTGPVRAGIFATASTVTRAQTGGSYYGVMEMSGNLWERVVTLGNATGRGFAGTHGDGILTNIASYYGNATNTDWPGINATQSRGVTDATGSGLKGGGYVHTDTQLLEVSDRTSAAAPDDNREAYYGGRCVRTASDGDGSASPGGESSSGGGGEISEL